jgi:hypothetical protein
MDPVTVSLVVGVAAAVPPLIEAVATAWDKWKRRKQRSEEASQPTTIIVETPSDDVTIRLGNDGRLLNEDGRPLDEQALPTSPKQILRIHLA